MAWVTVQPAGVELEVSDGESVAEAAWRQGYVWPTRCWGQVDCMSCFTRILDGELKAIPAEQDELDGIRLKLAGRLRTDPAVRLGCQLRCTGDGLVVEKRGFRTGRPEDNNMIEPAEPISE